MSSLQRSSSLLTSCRSLTASSSVRVAHSDLPEVVIPECTFSKMCWSRVDEFPDKPALVEVVSGQTFTLAEARSLARSFGSGLLRLGAQRGDVLAIVMPNSPEYTMAFMGASEAGLTITTLNPTYTPQEIRGQLANSESKYIVTTSLLLPKVQAATSGLDIQVILSGGQAGSAIDMESLLRDQGDWLESPAPVSSNDLCVLPYSSGTTGVPKGVMLTHGNLVANMVQVNQPGVELMTDCETTLCVLPMFHIFSMNVTMSNMLLNGGKLITIPAFDPGMFLAAMLKHRPTFLHLAPPLVQFLASHPAVTSDHLSSVSTIVVGAAPAGQALIDLFHARAPSVRFREGYGMTESSPVVTFTRQQTGDTLGSTGQLLPNTSLKVLDLVTGELMGAGQEGELCFKGPQVMPGYFKNPSATEETIVDGWCHTGDIGYYDQEGRVFIVDRKKELIKVKGLQVAPAELENLIRGMEGVVDVAVIGVPDPRAGEVPRAYVVRAHPELQAHTVQEHVASSLSRHKHLAGGVEFIAQIPKSAAGKILRKDLKSSYEKAQQ